MYRAANRPLFADRAAMEITNLVNVSRIVHLKEKTKAYQAKAGS